MIRPLFLLAIALLACSCVGRSERQDVTRLVNEWQGREVLLPDSEGDFTREVYIHGNLPNAPYILTLSGTVISK